MSEHDVYLAFGSNLGDRERNIAAALREVGAVAPIEAVSRLYETDPVPEGQPPYLNAVCHVSSDLPPEDLLRRLKAIERMLGRRGGKRWDPRPIDIDLLLYDDFQMDSGGLRLPHEGLENRAFVLVPLADVAAELRLPASGKTVRRCAEDCDASGVRVQKEVGWESA